WAVLQATASSHAQTISLRAQNITLADAMRSIQQQSGLPFFLNGKTLATSRIAIDVENVPLDQALDELLSPLSLEWILKNETIVIRPAGPSPGRAPRHNQQKTVSGNVTDVEGQPLPGVTISESGTGSTTTTDADGNYRLNISEGQSVVRFTSVGY